MSGVGVIDTHVHLDHAGDRSKLGRACRNATVVAHPRAVPHMIDPSKLVASASAVYGEAQFKRLYGTIDPALQLDLDLNTRGIAFAANKRRREARAAGDGKDDCARVR